MKKKDGKKKRWKKIRGKEQQIDVIVSLVTYDGGLPLERIILKKQKRESTYLILLTCPRNNTAIFHIKIAFAAGRKMVVPGRQLPGEIHFDRFHTLN